MATEGFNMSEADVLSLVKEVSATLSSIAADPSRLAKSDEGSASPKPEGSAPPSAEGNPDPSASASEPPPSAPPSAPTTDPSAAGGPPPGDAGAPGPDAGAAGPSFEELVTLYSQLPPEDFEAHAAAIQAAAQARSGGAGAPPAPPAGAPPMAPPGAPPSAPPMAPPSAPAFKSEDSKKLTDAISTIEGLKKSLDEQRQVIEALGKVVTTPQRRAVTGVTFIPMQKTEESATSQKKFADMSKSELHESLKTMTNTPDLKKSERDLITDFYLGKVERKSLAVLFKETK
jgi:hypothetical protein